MGHWFEWPDGQLSAPDFLCRLLDMTDCLLVLDLANLHADAINFGRDPLDMLDRLPLERVERVLAGAGRVARDAGGLVVWLPVFGVRRFSSCGRRR